MSTKVVKRSTMTRLLDDVERVALKTPARQKKTYVSTDDLLILIEYARQCEAVILMMDDDPSRAKELFGY